MNYTYFIYFYMTVSNFYSSFQSSFDRVLSKPYIIHYISQKYYFKDEINRNKVKNKISRNFKIESIDYEKNWVKKVDAKEQISIILSIFSHY